MSNQSVTTETFGITKNGEEAHRFLIESPGGARLVVTDFGATILELSVPDSKGKSTNVVLGYNSLKCYEEATKFFGITVGRVCGRIPFSKFELDGKEYTLAENDGEHHLHGGIQHFGLKVWDAEIVDGGVRFTYVSPDGEEGYPGTLKAQVTMTLTPDNALVLDYLANCDQDTVCNLTNHSYFNLSGEDSGESIADTHLLELASNRFLIARSDTVPTGEICSTIGTPFDFTQPTYISKALNSTDQQIEWAHGIDHFFLADFADVSECPNNNTNKKLNFFGRLKSEKTGIQMECWTTAPGAQVYSGNYVDDPASTTTSGVAYGKNNALCMETQNCPFAIDQSNFPAPFLWSGTSFAHRTEYRFSK